MNDGDDGERSGYTYVSFVRFKLVASVKHTRHAAQEHDCTKNITVNKEPRPLYFGWGKVGGGLKINNKRACCFG